MNQVTIPVNVSVQGAEVFLCVCLESLPDISATGPDAGQALLALEAVPAIASLTVAGFQIVWVLSS